MMSTGIIIGGAIQRVAEQELQNERDKFNALIADLEEALSDEYNATSVIVRSTVQTIINKHKMFPGRNIQDQDVDPREKTRDYNEGSSNYADNEVQPWEVWLGYSLNPWDADILKRLLRSKADEGMTPQEQRILDYQKIQHICSERIDQIRDGDPYYKNRRFDPSNFYGDDE